MFKSHRRTPSRRSPQRLFLYGAAVFALLLLIAPNPSSAGQGATRSIPFGHNGQHEVLNHLRTKTFQVVGGGPAGMMAFIRQYNLLKKLHSESATRKAVEGATIDLYEKRFQKTDKGVVEPSYTRAQILRLDMHAVGLLQGMEHPDGPYKGLTVFELLFDGPESTGHCLDEIKQPSVLEVGYDNVKFGEKAGLFDPDNTFCHIQTKKLEEALYEYARQTLEFDRLESSADGTPPIRGSMHFGWEWQQYEFQGDADDPHYASTFFNHHTKEKEIIPFDVLISAQGACSGSPGKCAVSARQQVLHPAGLGLGHGTTRLGRGGKLPKLYTPSFQSLWEPADKTVMSWGMTGFFTVELLKDTPKVLLTTWGDTYHLERYGGPVQVRSFYNKDIHYIGLGLAPATVKKFRLDDPSSEHAQDHYFKFWEMIIYDFEGHPSLTRETRMDPEMDRAHTPQLFPIVLFKSRDSMVLLPPSQKDLISRDTPVFSGRSAIVTFQGDEARLPNFVTASGINWGYYGVDRGMTNVKNGCAGLYNMMKNFIRLSAAVDNEGALRCLQQMNDDSASLSDSLAARAQTLAEQFRDVSKSLPGGASVRVDYSAAQEFQLQSLAKKYLAGFASCEPEVPAAGGDGDACPPKAAAGLVEASLEPFLPVFTRKEVEEVDYTKCETGFFCFTSAVERMSRLQPTPATLEELEISFRENSKDIVANKLGSLSALRGRGISRVSRAEKCEERLLPAVQSADLSQTLECIREKTALPWTPRDDAPFKPLTRTNALILGCNEFSYFACVSPEDYHEASSAPTARVLPDWAARHYCPSDGGRMVCFNMIVGSTKYGWFDLPLANQSR